MMQLIVVVGLVLVLGSVVLPLLYIFRWQYCRERVEVDEKEAIIKKKNKKKKKKKKKGKIPDGSMGYWPLLGETLDYLKPHPSNSLGQFLEEHCSRYGKLFKSHLFGGATIVSCDVEMTRFVLQNEGKLFSSSYPKAVNKILGSHCMLLVSAQQHRKLRSAAISHIGSSKSSPRFLHFLHHLSTSLFHSWTTSFINNNHPHKIPFLPVAKQFTLHVMLKNLIDMEPEDPVAPTILKDFLTFMKGFVSLPLYFPGTTFAKAMKARTRISSTIRGIMEERKKKMKDSEYYSRSSSSSGDFLDEILKKEDWNDEERVSIVMDLLLAGYETTSALLALLLYFLSHSPQALQQLREEHLDIRRKKDPAGEPLNFEDYKQMDFTMKVINETLRCGNLVKFVHRKALKDVKFKEYLIPRGWKVLPILSAVHLDPCLHQHPSLFDPWRWKDEETVKKVMPFGGGARFCPGAELGKIETSFFLHHFILNYSWKIEDDECPVSVPYLDFRRGLLMEIQPIRDKNA